MKPTAVSLFAGVGGIDLALESAGFRVTSAVEINPAARGVLADRFPTTTLHDDVTKVSADELRADGFVPDRGVITAGFPCQDLSVAGRRKGMGSGTRSGLYWHVVRLLAELRPRWVLLENVPGLLSAVCPCLGDGVCGGECPGELHTIDGGACGPGRCMGEHGGAMGAVLGSLGDLGYGFAYRVLDAQHFGVPQRRRRVVIVGCLGDDRRPVEVLLEPEGSGGDSAPGDKAGARIAATLTAGSSGPGVSAPGRRHEDDFNLVVSPTLTACGAPEGGRTDKIPVVVQALTASGVGTCGADDNQGQAGHLVPVTFQKVVRSGERDAEGNLPPEVWATRDVAATLNCGDNASESRATELIVHPLAVRGRDGGAQIEGGPEGGPYNALRAGDGGSSRQSLIAVTATGETAHTLTSEGHDASEDGTGRGTPVVAFAWQAGGNNDASGAFKTDMTPTLPKSQTLAVHTETTVRRLTPRECERLQGFPDDWTATSNGKAQTDSPRYQQMGNAVAVPVFAWVARRIAAAP